MNDSSASSDQHKPSLGASIVLCIVLALLVGWLRLGLFLHSAVGIGYALPIVLLGWTRRPRVIWGMAGLFAAMAVVKFALNIHNTDLPIQHQILSFSLLMADLLVVAGIVVQVIDREAKLLLREEALRRREQELKMSNEGLLERQQMMEVLLKLSRALAVGISRREILAEITGTIRLLLGATTVVAIWELRGQGVEMTGHEGFGAGGPETLSGDCAEIFAGHVMQQREPMVISSILQKPEIKRERSRDGEPYAAMVDADEGGGGNHRSSGSLFPAGAELDGGRYFAGGIAGRAGFGEHRGDGSGAAACG